MLSKFSRAVCLAAVIATATCATAETVMTHHLHTPLRGSKAVQPVGKLPAAQVLTLDVVLPLRDPVGLDNFIALVNDPASPSYRQFLTPAQFAAAFGPTQADYDTVLAFLKTNGFTVYGGTFLGHEIQVKAPVSVIESTFHVSMNVYQHPTENRTFYSPDREPSSNLSVPLWHITGLDNYSIPKPRLVKREDYAKAKGVSPQSLTPNATTGSGPSRSFLGSDMRAAYYSAAGGTLTGAGQTVGLLEYYGTDLADLQLYFANVGQTNNVPVSLISTDGTSVNCYNAGAVPCDDGEQNLDMTQAIGMAPGLAALNMFVGSEDTPILSSMVTTSPLAATIGCSWGWDPADPTQDDPYFKQMIAQGQNFFVASGDDSTWSADPNSAAFAWPGDDAYIVSVGGTSLQTTSAGGPWKSETAWTDSGGGISTDGIAIPSWQSAIGVGSTTLRNGPDVSANADFTFYTCGDQETCLANEYGGTSFAAPMWAAYIALVNQGLTASGKSTLGFLNPLIYAENATPATYAANFHDITSGTSGSYSAAVGFDLVTGWGSPTQALSTTLIATTPTGTPDFFLSSVIALYTPITTGYSVPGSISITSHYGFTGAVALTCAPSGGLTCSLSSGSTTLTSNATNTVTLSLGTKAVTSTGTYPVTITGTGSSGTHTLVIYVQVTTVTAPVLTLTNGGPITIASPGGSGSTSIGLASNLTFSGSVALSCAVTTTLTNAVLPTCSVAPSPVTMAYSSTGTSTLTINTVAAHLKSGANQSSLAVKPVAWLAGGLFLALLLVPVRRRRLPMLAALLTLGLLLGNVVGCSGSSSPGSSTPGTTLGAYTVTVTGSGASTSVALTVN